MKQLFTAIMILLSLGSFASVRSSFTCSSVKGCSPLVVNLTDHSTGTITNRHWDFGNGNNSTQINPSATFLASGVYTIKLVVSNGADKDSSTQTITVFSSPIVDFAADRSALCPNDSMHFTNHVTAGSAPVTQYAWGFGNGIASSDMNASYRFPQSGIYDVTLVVQDTNGCNGHLTKPAFITVWPKPGAAFTATPLTSCGSSQIVDFTSQASGNGLVYDWHFGDSTSSASANPSHLYSYGNRVAKMFVRNNFGCIDSAAQNVNVIYVKANFFAYKTTVCAGEKVNFVDNSPMAGRTWHWDFGDGTSSSKQNPAKIYTHPGVYSVTFIVTDGLCRDSSTTVNYITVTQGFAVSFTADNHNSCTVPFTVNFTSNAPSGTTLTWNFGDGNADTTANPTNTYTTASIYGVSLTAVDSTGCTVSSTIPGFINTSRPSTQFASDTLVCPHSPVQFGNSTHNATRYLWNFGDGDTSTLKSPLHSYANYGRYTVSLTAWDSIGCDSTFVRPSYIHVDSTKVDFSVDEKFSMCPPLVSIFSSHANRNDLRYRWDFGDGFTDTAANPTHIYFHPGVYTVRLIGSGAYGCYNTVTYTNLITVQGPSATFTMNPNSGCVPVNVSFSATPTANTQRVICDLGDGTLYTDSLHFHYTYNAPSIYHPKFILTDQIGCTVAYDMDSIVTHAVPVISLKDTSICAGQSATIHMGSGYQWKTRSLYVSDSSALALSPCDTCGTVSLTPQDTTVYIVRTANQFGCSATGSFRINVDQLPVLSAQDTIKLCRNASFTMDVVKQADRVIWSPSTYLTSATAFAPTCTPAQDENYTVSAYNKMGCVSTQTVPVRVYNHIPLTVTHDTAVCAGAQVQLNASVSDTFFHGVTYSWKNSAQLNSTNIADPMATIETPETFEVIASSGSCPVSTASVTVGVHTPATVKLPAQMVTTAYAELSITPVSGDLTSYLWSAKNQLSCTECATTTLVPTESQVVYLEGKNQYGCSTKDSMMIHILNCDPTSIFVPNTFTPNGDGSNDKLYVRSRTLSQLEYFRLFNRWGAVVYESKSISEGWDGNINGKIAEQGVYVYQISGKCESGYDVSTSGTVTLIR
jgi:gliding motility-associated-like protein